MPITGSRWIGGAVMSVVAAAAMQPAAAVAAPAPQPVVVHAPQAGPAPLRPAVGALFGAYVDPDAQWTGVDAAMQEVTTFETQIARKLDIDHHYYGWDQVFPGPLDQWDVSMGRIPLISWQGPSLNEVLSGANDALIRARADDVKAFGASLFLTWGWEMNGNWTLWGGAQSSDPGTTNGPAKYVAAWRHIHDIFVQEGATNAVWVWTVNNQSVPNAPWNDVAQYYPGDTYVDWVGIDGYNWGSSESWSGWYSFSSLFAPVYDRYHTAKPVMIVETASVESGGSKAGWIANAMADMNTTLPDIAAIVWFDANKEHDWRPNSSPTAFETYKLMGTSPYFQQKDGGVLSTGGGGGGGSKGGGSGGGSTPPSSRLLRKVSGTGKPVRRHAVVSFSLTRPARIWITIERRDGRVVKRRRVQARYGSGRHRVRWFLRSWSGFRVPGGRYVAAVLAVDRWRRTDSARAGISVGPPRRTGHGR
jgi:hypothetical protein